MGRQTNTFLSVYQNNYFIFFLIFKISYCKSIFYFSLKNKKIKINFLLKTFKAGNLSIHDMKKSKLAEILRSFSNLEWRRFRQMVDSPYFNRNEEVSRLCDWISTLDPSMETLRRDEAMAHLFPGEKDEARLNHTMSFLLKLAEDFIGMENYWEDKYAHSNNVLKALDRRELEKNYPFQLEKSRKTLTREQHLGAHFFYNRYTLEIIEASRMHRKASRRFNESVQIATDSLDQFYLLEKLRRTCYMYISQAVLATPYHLQLVDEVCRFVGENLSQMAAPAIEAYYRIFQMLSKHQADDDFQALKTLLAEQAGRFTPEDLSDAYQYAINFCNVQIMQRPEPYVAEAFELYANGIQSGILLENGEFSPWHFKNVVGLAIRQQKYSWAEAFIADYVRQLPREFQQDALHFNFALLYYNTRRFDEALQHLQKVEFTDVYYSLGAKVMLCQIYFEEGHYDALDSLLHAFGAYLRRNRFISENQRQAYANFIFFLKKIAASDPRHLAGLSPEIEKTNPVAVKDWLIQKCNNY